MTDVTLTMNGITFTFNEGDVDKITSKIITNIDPINLAISGPMGTIVYDQEGASKNISITGKLTVATTTRISGYTITTLLAQKQWLESLAGGNQTAITLTSNYETQSVLSNYGATAPFQGAFTSTTGKIASLEFTEEEANPDQLPFSITFEVGT